MVFSLRKARLRAAPRPDETGAGFLERVRRAGIAFALVLTGAATAWAEGHEGGVTVAHGISSFGALKYEEGFAHFDYVNPEAPKGGYFSQWAFGTFDSANPFVRDGVAVGGAALMYDSLMAGSADEPDSAYGLVAETIEYPEDRSWVIFNMRPEARFHDGTPITAEDVVATYDALMEFGNPARYRLGIFADFEGVEALDTHRVRFDFKDGVSTRNLPLLAGGMSILSKDWLDNNDFTQTTLDPIPGSGPYRLKSIDAGRSVVYERVEDYWGADLPVNVGSNNFDEYRWEYFTDSTAAFEAFKAGVYTFRQENTSRLWATAYDWPALNDGYVARETLPDGRSVGTQGWWINMRRDRFQDPRVREAISLMFNFEFANQALFYGLYNRTDSFWENTDFQATGMPSEEELALLEPVRDYIPETVFSEEAYVPPVSGGQRLDRRLQRRAVQLFREAGWTLQNGRLVNEAGEQFRIEILNDSPSFERIINGFAQNLEAIGIDVDAEMVDAAQAQRRQRELDFDMVTQGFRMSLTPSQSTQVIFGSQSANEPDTFNLSGIANEGVDQLLLRIGEAETRDELRTRVQALDRVLRSMFIWVPQWHSGQYFVAYLDVYSRPEIIPPYSLATGTWWWDEEKADRLRAAGVL
ncbi:extracellular solute-binding protein [Pontivivens ytuae]|uniref:ABC transporter substrate-binding protein n=1 Tax=Pontivivens ytuae TaxID=2789856 RepID=A0A7S9LTP6_9RHOB|nr:extracellular solute-binding protein [Pontivivens ytuae]QPH55089.1 ABC transporter substrate-binding protein [Pontivivens ytuae]